MTQRFQKLGRRGKFQHDNDPQHTAKISQELLKTQLAVQRLEGNLVHQCILILSFAVFTFK
uniref:Uncharacterized protein n=1 Tax=Astatotilapia calliptera TaxID=8154 RepID=A0AAX7TGU3_ASTCA